MRKITKIIVHCSDSSPLHRYTFEQCKRDHICDNGWDDIGYHYYIELDGEIYKGRNLYVVGAHCYGHNADSIGICYEGGKGGDTRTPEQKEALSALINCLRFIYPGIKVYSHHDFNPAKSCPCFDAAKEYN